MLICTPRSTGVCAFHCPGTTDLEACEGLDKVSRRQLRENCSVLLCAAVVQSALSGNICREGQSVKCARIGCANKRRDTNVGRPSHCTAHAVFPTVWGRPRLGARAPAGLAETGGSLLKRRPSVLPVQRRKPCIHNRRASLAQSREACPSWGVHRDSLSTV